MKAYKGFQGDLKCLGYQFSEGMVHIEAEANCIKNGFHCAEDPLDCLSYYPNWDRSVYYIVDAGGDIDEDGADSKISCTELTLIRKLTLEDFIVESMEYIKRHPMRKPNHHIQEERSNIVSRAAKFTVVRGKNPMAAGEIGTVLGFAKEEKESQRIVDMAVIVVDGFGILENTWYTLEGGKVVPVDKEAV